MDKEYMRNYYRRMYENPRDFVIADSEEFEEKKKIRYALEDKLEEMKAAFEKGFKEAEKTWGGELPEICQRTYDKVFEKFDKLINPEETATIE